MTYHTLIAFALLLALPECTQPEELPPAPWNEVTDSTGPVPPCDEVWCERHQSHVIVIKPE